MGCTFEAGEGWLAIIDDVKRIPLWDIVGLFFCLKVLELLSQSELWWLSWIFIVSLSDIVVECCTGRIVGKVLKFELFLFRHPEFIEWDSLRGMRLPFVALWWVKHGKANIVHILPAPKFNMAHLKMAPKMNRRFWLWKPSFWGEPATKLGESKHIETATRMGPQNFSVWWLQARQRANHADAPRGCVSGMAGWW